MLALATAMVVVVMFATLRVLLVSHITWHQFHLQSSSPWARGSRRRGGDESRSPRCRALSGPPLPQDQGQDLLSK